MNRNENEGIVDKVKDALGMGDEHEESRDERVPDEPMADDPMREEPMPEERVGVGGRSRGGRSPEMSNDPAAETGESPYGTRGSTDRADHGQRRDDDLV